jgi:dihydroflavonol-4-reductase
MQVAVTGASGHIGGHLVRSLLAEGHQVRALYASDTRPLDGLALEKIRCDVNEPASLQQAFAGVELVFHLAARISLEGDADGSVWRANVDGTRNVCAACLAKGVRRLVHFSSVHALRSDPLDEPMDEARGFSDEGPLPCMPYDRTKAAAERVVQEAIGQGLDAVMVNPTSVVGPVDYKPSAMGAVLLMIARRELPGLVDAGFDWVDPRDVAAGAIGAAKAGRKGERYLLGGRWASICDLAAFAADEAGVKLPHLVAPLWLARMGTPFAVGWARLRGKRPVFTADSMETLRFSNKDVRHDKAASDLGYSPRPLEETIRDSIRWFQGEGMLPRKA